MFVHAGNKAKLVCVLLVMVPIALLGLWLNLLLQPDSSRRTRGNGTYEVGNDISLRKMAFYRGAKLFVSLADHRQQWGRDPQ